MALDNVPRDTIQINGEMCVVNEKPHSPTRQFIPLDAIERQILLRERILVKFLRSDDHSHHQRMTRGPGGHPRLGYSWQMALPDTADLNHLAARIQRDVPDVPYVIIGHNGDCWPSKDLQSLNSMVYISLAQVRAPKKPKASK